MVGNGHQLVGILVRGRLDVRLSLGVGGLVLVLQLVLVVTLGRPVAHDHQSGVDEALHRLTGMELVDVEGPGHVVDGAAASDRPQHAPLGGRHRRLGRWQFLGEIDGGGHRRHDGLDQLPLDQAGLGLAEKGLEVDRLADGHVGVRVEREAAGGDAQQLEQHIGRHARRARLGSDDGPV